MAKLNILNILNTNHLPSRLSWQNWTWHICQVYKTEQNRIKSNCCCPHCRCHYLGYSVPPASSPYHLVPKHLRATWPRPEQSHLLPEGCSPNGTDDTQQRQRRTKRPPPEPSDILKRFHALYDDELRYYKKKVSKLLTHFCPQFHKWNIRF